MLRRLISILILLALAASEAFAGHSVEGVVRKVFDGDTLLLATRRNSRLKVRLYGIDAPEASRQDKPGQPFGGTSKRTLMYKLLGRWVTAEIIDTDQYGRVVAVIRDKGTDINREMVEEGMAWAYREYLQGAYASEYIDAEERARARHKGLWRDTSPLPPWEFRHAHPEDRQRRQHRR